ncbi:LamG-like jellyroll fold domain-containing protein [Streptomyces sp. NPDC088762]|uniref:LamG-like jellyroll fold domain-containing protein n=1 Tax=Streptomyces sp. NPDC088762 TaxID=3365891 RepID=UPI0038241460
MTDGTNPPSNPQPEPAPGSGGYGFPPGPPASGGYGFPPGPPAQGGYGFPPQPAPGAPAPAPDQGGYGYPQFGQAPTPFGPGPGIPGGPFPPQGGPFPPPADQPDWEAMADRSAKERRRKKMLVIGGSVVVLALLAAGGSFLLMGKDKDGPGPEAQDKPSTSTSSSTSPGPSGSGSKSKAPADDSATVPGDPTQIRDRTGKAHLKMGPDAGVFPVDKRNEIRMKETPNSYAQSTDPVVDVSKSFTVSARVYSVAQKGQRVAVSQGDGDSFSFALGAEEVNGKMAWVFKVQTGDQGADATVTTVVAQNIKVERSMTALAGTYDAEKKIVTLYVNGKKAGESQVGQVFKAPGPLQLGRVRQHGNWAGSWNGSLDSLRTYGVALTADQVAALRSGKLSASIKPTGSWLLV